ncbi:MAG: LysM peptidoglycan-binding domain-containing protein [Chitinophagaceae bacterium]|nr:LysM peptidoglycan-binding domain-containing protein [Chitinophagaceae bacterium]
MAKLFFSLLFFAGSFLAVKAQKAPVLIIKNNEKGFYLDHKVVPKESFYSVGRLYNVSPKYLAAFNKLDLNKGLQIDQKLKIPLTDTNFSREGNSGTPVYYKTGDKEGLMKVSGNNGNLSLAKIRGWNNLTSDVVEKDTRLIVGFLHSKEMPSVTIKPKAVTEEPVVEVKPVTTDPVKTTDPVQPTQPKTDPVVDTKPIEPVVVTPVKVVPANEVNEVKNNATELGYFKSSFDKQVLQTPVTKNETITSGIFKTLSGWQDGKYYLLIDGVPPGNIVKLTNPATNRVVYAKVLGEMMGIRQNEGLNIRISNAAAAALQVTEQDKFILKINY